MIRLKMGRRLETLTAMGDTGMPSETRTNVPIRALLVFVLLFSCAAILYVSLFPAEPSDLGKYNIHWYEHLKGRGGFPGLSDLQANYSPPYLYVLAMIGNYLPTMNSLPAIKIASVPFLLVSSVFVILIVRMFHEANPIMLAIAGGGYFLLPTTVYDVAFMGQSDAMYTAFLLASFWCLLRFSHPALGLIAFGIALSIKVQAALFAPFVLYWLIHNRRSVHELLIIPIAYALPLVPAVIYGRSLHATFLVYADQFQANTELSKNAPNVHLFFDMVLWRLPHPKPVSYILVGAFLVVALEVAAILAGTGLVRVRQTKLFYLCLATTVVAVMPSILPKMHEQFFFPADDFSYVLMLANWRFWPICLGLQIGSFISYMAYCYRIENAPLFGVPFTLVAVTMLLLVTTAEWKPYGPALSQKAESRVPLLGRLRIWLRPDGS
jgi:Gpi18-like mannosyltransferase